MSELALSVPTICTKKARPWAFQGILYKHTRLLDSPFQNLPGNKLNKGLDLSVSQATNF